MKRSIAILIAAALLAALLAGCGEMDTSRPAASATPVPENTLLPESMMPDPEDGVVNDTDGIIEPGDSGTSGQTGGTTSGMTNGKTGGTASGTTSGTTGGSVVGKKR